MIGDTQLLEDNIGEHPGAILFGRFLDVASQAQSRKKRKRYVGFH